MPHVAANERKALDLIMEIMAKAGDDLGIMANELLRELHRGAPVELIEPLVVSEEQHIAGIGMFLLAELGKRASPFVEHCVRMLNYPVPIVRHDAILVLLQCATQDHGKAIADVIRLFEHSHQGTRWGVLHFLSKASEPQLDAAFKYFETADAASPYRDGLSWLIGGSSTGGSIIERLRSPDRIVRVFAVVQAIRTAEMDIEPFLQARGLDDHDLRTFVTKWPPACVLAARILT